VLSPSWRGRLVRRDRFRGTAEMYETDSVWLGATNCCWFADSCWRLVWDAIRPWCVKMFVVKNWCCDLCWFGMMCDSGCFAGLGFAIFPSPFLCVVQVLFIVTWLWARFWTEFPGLGRRKQICSSIWDADEPEVDEAETACMALDFGFGRKKDYLIWTK